MNASELMTARLRDWIGGAVLTALRLEAEAGVKDQRIAALEAALAKFEPKDAGLAVVNTKE